MPKYRYIGRYKVKCDDDGTIKGPFKFYYDTVNKEVCIWDYENNLFSSFYNETKLDNINYAIGLLIFVSTYSGLVLLSCDSKYEPSS